MAQSSPQFTAAQVLEAGQQAEAGGNHDYAVQFYRHITDHHPHSMEAASAREALNRIFGYQFSAPPMPEPAAAEPRPDRPGTPSGFNGRDSHDSPDGYDGAATPSNATSARQFTPSGHHVAPHSSHRGAAPMPVSDADMRRPIPTQFLLPSQYDHYRTGRFLTTMSTVLGWLVLICGIGAAVASTGLIPGSAEFIAMVPGMAPGLVPGLIYGAAGLFGGLLMIFVSQLARAVFDHANAARDLASIERARARQSQPLD